MNRRAWTILTLHAAAAVGAMTAAALLDYPGVERLVMGLMALSLAGLGAIGAHRAIVRASASR